MSVNKNIFIKDKHISEIAYFNWLNDGCPDNSDLNYWLNAEIKYNLLYLNIELKFSNVISDLSHFGFNYKFDSQYKTNNIYFHTDNFETTYLLIQKYFNNRLFTNNEMIKIIINSLFVNIEFDGVYYLLSPTSNLTIDFVDKCMIDGDDLFLFQEYKCK